MRYVTTALGVLILSFFVAGEAIACAVCFGDPNSAMAKGATAGILVLLGVIGTLLLSIIGVIVFWSLRAKRLTEMQNAVPLPVTSRS